MSIIEQTLINEVLDDLSLKFLANHWEEELKSTNRDTSIPFIWCDVPVDGAIPDAILTDKYAVVRLVDRIHELMSSIHSEMDRWSIHCFDMTDGHTYFVMLHEDACIADLCNFIQQAEEDGRASMEHLVQWMELQEAVDKTRSVFPQLYDGLKALGIEGMPTRMWREHALYYEEGTTKHPPSFLNQLVPSDKEKLYEALLSLPPPPSPPVAWKWTFIEKGMPDYEDFSDEFSRSIETCYLGFLNNPHMRDVQSVVDRKVGNYKVDFINMHWKSGDRSYTIRRVPTHAAWSDM